MSQIDFDSFINTHIVQNFDVETSMLFMDGLITDGLPNGDIDWGKTWVNFPSVTKTDKPQTGTFLTYRMVSASSNNAVIRSRDVYISHDNISLEFSINRPVSDGKSKSNEIERKLDIMFKNKEFVSEGFQCLADTETPKNGINEPAMGDDTHSVRILQYRFIVRYGND